MNNVFDLIAIIKGVKGGVKNEKTHQNIDGFLSVAGNLKKSNEFLEDYYKIACVNDDL
ncbi:hypothetical protein [Flavobacterium sp. ZS1P14]|uniref:hypothetical protein n=1 Tax=Flavobacterium sp. ZS1P14 TaxID=3401729 RepID=UPI003AAD78AD